MISYHSKSMDLMGTPIRRVLPTAKKRMVGPFLFLDHMGPVTYKPGSSTDVGPHPHIGLATLTYLFKGKVRHQDSLGSDQVIIPGDVNWMVAGSGVSHSERGVAGVTDFHGLQFWVALPDSEEDCDPLFINFKKDQIPKLQDPEKSVEVILGKFQNLTSPVPFSRKVTLLNVNLNASKKFHFQSEDQEVAIYMISGNGQLNGESVTQHQVVIFESSREIQLTASEDCHFIVMGGSQYPQQKQIFWNFVSSSKEKIKKAQTNWNSGNFPMVPGETGKIESPVYRYP